MKLDASNSALHLLATVGQRREQAMPWAYFDESGFYDDQDKLEALVVGGCVASAKSWTWLVEEWQAALDKERVKEFHAKDFYTFNREFSWLTTDGQRDIDRHDAFRDRLAEIIVRHCDTIIGHFNNPRAVARSRVRDAYYKGVDDVLMEFIKSPDPEGLYVILARHPELSPWTILRRFETINWQRRLLGVGVFETKEVPQLQAADFVCHAMKLRGCQGVESAAFKALVANCKRLEKPFIHSWRASSHPEDA